MYTAKLVYFLMGVYHRLPSQFSGLIGNKVTTLFLLFCHHVAAKEVTQGSKPKIYGV